MHKSKVLQAALDHPELQQYFHPEEPGRVPLLLVCPGAFCEGVELEKFGQSVETVQEDPGGRPAMRLEDASVEGDRASVVLTYPVEGVRAELQLTLRGDDWVVSGGNVFEQ